MGGGSGNWCRWNTRTTTASQHRVDIRWLRKQGYLHPGTSGPISWSCNDEETGSIRFRIEKDRMILNYRHRPQGGEWEEVEQTVPIVKTSCNYGGYRQWFLCPLCRKRVELLYGTGKYFLCRHCHNLTYDSSNASPLKRIFDKANKLRKKLGRSDGFLDFIPQRPKGMHKSTYNSTVAEINRLEGFGRQCIFNQYGMRF